MYDTANRLADDDVRQKNVTFQNVRDVLERVHQNKVKMKYVFAPKLFCEESQRNVAETLLHPIERTVKLRAVVLLSNDSMANHVLVFTVSVTMMVPFTLRCARGALNTH